MLIAAIVDELVQLLLADQERLVLEDRDGQRIAELNEVALRRLLEHRLSQLCESK